ncbi:MAG: transporter [Elusimicrobia bacterium]|nr:transporter [Elusimicrobiota bacterium]
MRLRLGSTVFGLVFLGLSLTSQANDIEPRRWGHLPIGGNFLTAGYAYTEANIYLDPVLRIEDVKMKLDTWLGKYIHSFSVFGKSARIDLTQGYQEGRWDGTIDGAPRSVQRKGPSDSYIRFATNLYGAPPLKGKDFAAYRRGVKRETIVGAGLVVQLPTGDYMEDKLINLGSNRFTIRPQLGVTHTVGKWTGELTGEVYFYTDNAEFFNGNKLEQAPLYTGQTHLIYTLRPGLWMSGSLGYSEGGASTLNGKTKDDKRNATAWALSLGLPLAPHWNAKASYLNSRAQHQIGQDTDTLALGLSYSW